MGQAKIRQYNKQQFLRENPFCTYCGDPATTIDHCPPRAFFLQRNWPESYEFPACERCNQETRRDELILAVLVRVLLQEETEEPAQYEWRGLVTGLMNNYPEVIWEWRGIGGSQIKRALRATFGNMSGDIRRQRGWGAINLSGPLTRAAIQRFGIKLGQALYYRHVRKIFEGDIYVTHLDPVAIRRNPQRFQETLKLAPQLATSRRNNKDLSEQFIYRFDSSVDIGVVNAVIQIGHQFLFHILAISAEMVENMAAAGEPRPVTSPHAVHAMIRRSPKVDNEAG